MITSHTLLNKCDRFSLTKHVTPLRKTYYKINLNLKYRYWIEEETLNEYDTILDGKNRTNKFTWEYKNEDQARSKYNWAVLKWNN